MQRLQKILALAIICAAMAVRALKCPARCTCNSTRVACNAAIVQKVHLGRQYFLPYGAHLSEVSWTNSKLQYLDTRVFEGLSGLEHIDLSRNELTTIYGDVFGGQSGLKTLNLSRNAIEGLAYSMFNNLTSLEVLDLSHNRFYSVPYRIFTSLNKLQYLDLSHNGMFSLDEYFNDTAQLKVLIVNNNKIDKIKPAHLTNLKELETLDISSNKLNDIPGSVFKKVLQLRELNISFNPLKSLSQDAFMNLQNLRWLSMSGSKLRTLPPALFQYNENLETIYLDHTELEVIQNDTLIGLRSLQKLYIRNNTFLREIETLAFQDTLNITHLDLSSNELLTVPKSLTMLNYLQELRLSNNPWACDCRMVWFAGWAENNLEIIKSDLTCSLSYPTDMIATLNHLNCEPTLTTQQSFDGIESRESDIENKTVSLGSVTNMTRLDNEHSNATGERVTVQTTQQSFDGTESGTVSSESVSNMTRMDNEYSNATGEPVTVQVKKQTTEATSSVVERVVQEEADENDLFGQILARKLKKMSNKDRLMLTHEIQNLVFNYEIKAISKS